MTSNTDSTYDNDSILDNAINAPEEFVNASTGRSENSIRGKGITLTKNEIIQLRMYEIAGLALPTAIQDVITYLGYTDGAGPGLSANDFRDTFIVVHNHAARWNPISVKIKAIGSELKVFAGQLQIYGDDMSRVLSEIKGSKTFRELNIETYDDLKRAKIDMNIELPDIELDAAGLDTAKDFGYYLTKMLEKVQARKADAEAVKVLLHDFDKDLSLSVRPKVSMKLASIKNTPLHEEVKKLQVVINQRTLDIDEKTKEYKKLVGDSLASAAAGGVFGLGMAIYTGSEAEKIRKERNRLKKLQAADIELLSQKNSIAGNLSRIELDMQDLQLLVIDADAATKNLVTVWNALSLYADKSQDEAKSITDVLKANRFESHFRSVVEPWKLIGETADELLDVFKEADDEIKRRSL
ncbi:alpha-xenorhabdolysin family binary toxin subunit A [Pseudomonas sp. 10B1]|uniref:alpha-xenorhabdolysin family binary toxin subunit A n=1 Tax=unclassified Pseudomonas TaxID=196821 RepID=UPI002B23B2BE|nr:MULTISPECIES: alpha-xenorhabdolysin family binary toxin subunit A [unclassified Pseudomonas]MEB0089118.1 alpha-xenorhabdolysin family binary toxin subunit A [Pseudomonas sp. RTI1]MEB0127245.1 alpha-xenorhabdolysin family binary toxin subunit A [Pseudomonas sp. CCC1.2]MEB0155931.1 alpha-xenorhabdolysin family binary toxin subunit A [Pseudomonas sp. CCC4.3]MEB0220391.1 alpha-xenorhabdolysin family binary toxin subunit A [Pseudomonas sp. AB12(2023)]MEB0310650.1 alpha-xenorhabdolysin family bin